MDASVLTLRITIYDENKQAITIESVDKIKLEEIQTIFKNEFHLTEEEIKNYLFYFIDEDGDKNYLQEKGDNEDILLNAKQNNFNSLSLTLYSEKMEVENISTKNDNKNQKSLGDKNNNEKNIINKKIDKDNGSRENEINKKESKKQDNEYEKKNKAKKSTESLNRKICNSQQNRQ